MKFSVIIPVYNCEAYLRKCLDSIFNQDYGDFELLLINDGSSDNTGAICEEYGAKYPNIRLFNQPNSGPSIARNRGIREAVGDYLLFVDGDDWVLPGYFQVLDAALGDGAWDFVFFGSSSNNEVTIMLPRREFSSNQELIQFYGQTCQSLPYSSCYTRAISARVIKNNDFHFIEHTVVEEDFLFNLSLFNVAARVRFIDDVLYHYNQRSSGSVTTVYNPRKFVCKLQAYEQELYYAEKWHLPQVRTYFQEQLLTFVSACINNLTYPQCNLTYGEKIAAIREYFSSSQVLACARECRVQSLRAKLMVFFIRYKLHRMAYWFHYVVKRLKGMRG